MSTPDTPQVSAEDRNALAQIVGDEFDAAAKAAGYRTDEDLRHLGEIAADAVIDAGWRPAPTPVEHARPDALEITKAITEAIHEHREDFQRPSEAGTAVAVYERLAHLGMIDRRSAASPVPAEGDKAPGYNEAYDTGYRRAQQDLSEQIRIRAALRGTPEPAGEQANAPEPPEHAWKADHAWNCRLCGKQNWPSAKVCGWCDGTGNANEAAPAMTRSPVDAEGDA